MSVWKNAMQVAESIFQITKNLPQKEDYGLTSQIRRSGLSISANIAEAFGRHSIRDKIQFYYIARGSAYETINHLEYGSRVNYFTIEKTAPIQDLLFDIINELNKIIKSLGKLNY